MAEHSRTENLKAEYQNIKLKLSGVKMPEHGDPFTSTALCCSFNK